MVTMREYKTIMTVLIARVRQNYGFTHVSFVRNVTHVSFPLVARAREFLNREISTKAKTHHLHLIYTACT